MRRGMWIAIIVGIAVAVTVASRSGGGDDDTSDDVVATSPPTEAPASTTSGTNGTTTTEGAGTGRSVDQIPGDPAEDVPSALDDLRDDAFPEPLVDPDDIRSGGPPPDGIPAIDDPRFQPASSVDWLDDVEPVLVLEVDGEARAYPVQVMIWHELVNDTFDDLPVTVSYCPLCNSAIAYVRRADGRTFDFGTSGRLLNSSLVMYDRQTESLWSHFTGEAIIGSLTGTRLETLPVSTVSWATFREAHPDGLVLTRDTGFGRSYGANPYPGYDDVDATPFLFDGEVDGRLAAQTRVVAVRGDDETIAIPWDDVVDAGVLEVTVDGRQLLVLHAPGTASALDAPGIADGRDVGAVGVYPAELDGTPLELEAGGDGTFTDPATGTTFDVLGRAVSGALAGAGLEPVEHLDTFWFAIAAFEPDTVVVTGPA